MNDKKIRKPQRKKKTERFKVTKIEGARSDSWLVQGNRISGGKFRKRYKSETEANCAVYNLSLETADTNLRTVATKLSDELADSPSSSVFGNGTTTYRSARFENTVSISAI